MPRTALIVIDMLNNYEHADAEQLAECGACARKLAEEQFSFDIMASRYEALYQSVLPRST